MTWFDYAVLGIVGASVLLSLIRGFVREIISLLAWFIAYVCANAFAGPVEQALVGLIANNSARWIAAFSGVFLTALIVTGLIGYWVSKLVAKAGFGLADRGLGGLFGFARGVLIVLVLVTIGGMTRAPQLPGWRNAVLAPLVHTTLQTIKPLLPSELSKHIQL